MNINIFWIIKEMLEWKKLKVLLREEFIERRMLVSREVS